jgi:hypothetical protein
MFICENEYKVKFVEMLRVQLSVLFFGSFFAPTNIATYIWYVL